MATSMQSYWVWSKRDTVKLMIISCDTFPEIKFYLLWLRAPSRSIGSPWRCSRRSGDFAMCSRGSRSRRLCQPCKMKRKKIRKGESQKGRNVVSTCSWAMERRSSHGWKSTRFPASDDSCYTRRNNGWWACWRRFFRKICCIEKTKKKS